MKHIYILTGIYSILSMAIVVVHIFWDKYNLPEAELVKFYADHLQDNFFSGFLTIAAFIFSLKTFIIMAMKDRYYSTEYYKKIYILNKELSPELKRYQPLDHFRILLSLTVLVSLITALYQITFAFMNYWLISYIGITLAIYTILLFIYAFYIMWMNLGDLVESWEQGNDQ